MGQYAFARHRGCRLNIGLTGSAGWDSVNLVQEDDIAPLLFPLLVDAFVIHAYMLNCSDSSLLPSSPHAYSASRKLICSMSKIDTLEFWRFARFGWGQSIDTPKYMPGAIADFWKWSRQNHLTSPSIALWAQAYPDCYRGGGSRIGKAGDIHRSGECHQQDFPVLH